MGDSRIRVSTHIQVYEHHSALLSPQSWQNGQTDNRASFNPSLSSHATHGSGGPSNGPAKPFLCIPVMRKRCWSLGGATIKTKGDSTVTSHLKPLQNDWCVDLADSPHRAFARSLCRNTDRWRSPCAAGRGLGDHVRNRREEQSRKIPNE